MIRTRKGFVLLTASLFIVLMTIIFSMPVYAAGSSAFDFEENSQNSLKLIGYNGNEKIVTVPSEIEGKTVESITSSVFKGHEDITDIFIPSSVQLISRNEFASFENLTLYGQENSYVQEYAASKNIPFIVVNSGEAVKLLSDFNCKIMKTGTEIPVNAAVFPENSSNTINIFSSDPRVASIEDGKVKALSDGKVRIIIQANNLTEEFPVTVYTPASRIAAPSSVTLGAEEIYNMSISIAPQNADQSRIRFTVSDNSVVRANGKVLKALCPGKAQVRTWYDGKVMSVTNITVKNTPSTVKFTRSAITAGNSEIVSIGSTVNEGSASAQRTYSSSNNNVAEILRDGWKVYIKAKSKGTARITVRTYNGRTSVCSFTVKDAPSKITLGKNEITIGVGETYQMSYALSSNSASDKKTYYSYNNNIAQFNQNGIVTARRAGQTTIGIKLFNGRYALCKVNVKAAPGKIELGRNKLTLVVGESYTLYSHINQNSASAKRKYTVTNSGVLSLDKTNWNGKITALKTGTSKVTVRTYNGKTDTCEVKVISSSVRKTIVDTAKAWLGYNEKDGSYKKIFDVYNQGRIPGSYYMRGLDPWCAAYVSAVFMKAGKVNMIYPSCSCPTMVNGAISKGIWVEDDSYVPERGDIIFYNWNDDGKGDCTRGASHVGIITDVNSGVMTVIEGNYDYTHNNINGDDLVGYRKVNINGQFIRGFIVPKYPN